MDCTGIVDTSDYRYINPFRQCFDNYVDIEIKKYDIYLNVHLLDKYFSPYCNQSCTKWSAFCPHVYSSHGEQLGAFLCSAVSRDPDTTNQNTVSGSRDRGAALCYNLNKCVTG